MNNKADTPFVISICSGKGGVGKSVLTANLANVLSKSLKVLIWDADLYFPNQHLLIGVEPPVRLTDVYSGKVAPSSALFSIHENLQLLADMPAAGKSEVFQASDLQEVCNSLIADTDFDIILIDTPAGGSYEVLQCAVISDLIAVVITDEPTSLLDAYGLIKIILPYIDTDSINLLVNNVIDSEDADEITKKLNLATGNFLDIELDYLGFVPYDRVVRQSILRQELFVDAYPEAEVSKAIVSIGDVILSKVPFFELI